MRLNDLMQTGWLWEPWRQFQVLENDLENLRHQAPGIGRMRSRLPFNVWDGNDELTLTAELPGVEPDSVDLRILDNRLTVTATPANAADTDADVKLERRERPAAEITRTLELPYRVDPDNAEATFEQGVLKLRLPRAAEDKPKQIAVKGV